MEVPWSTGCTAVNDMGVSFFRVPHVCGCQGNPQAKPQFWGSLYKKAHTHRVWGGSIRRMVGTVSPVITGLSHLR